MAAPYDSVWQVMYSAMMRLNDSIEAIASLGGVILENPSAFSQQAVNNAWRKLQDYLRNLGYQSLSNEVNFIAVGPVTSTDPLVQTYIGWDGYYNGTAVVAAPVLPQDFISPLELFERQNGTNGNMFEMDEMINGLPSIPKMIWNRLWQWRDERIYMPGAITPTDFRVRYAKYNADFLDNSPAAATPWFNQTVPIMNCQDSLAWFICYEFAVARQDMAAMGPEFKANAMDAAQLVFNRDVKNPTAIYKASEYSKMRDKYTPGPPNGLPAKPLIG